MPLIPPTEHEKMVMLQMTNLARQCEKESNPEDIYDRCAKAFELWCELHPTPKSDVERMLHRERMTQFDNCLRGDGFESAAFMMMPHYRQKPNGPQSRFGLIWGCSSYVGDEDADYRYPSATIIHPFTKDEVIGVGPTLGLALLAAMLRAHAEWHDIWLTEYYENDDGREEAAESL